MDTVKYYVTDITGTDTAIFIITINPLPVIASITGIQGVCMGTPTTFTNDATGGIWTTSNANATIEGGIVNGVQPGSDTIRYTVTNMCGVGIATTTITIQPLPVAGPITGSPYVSIGNTTTLADTTASCVWLSSNGNATVFGGIVTGIGSGIDTISYLVSNACGTDTASIAVFIKPLPNAGAILGFPNVCVGATVTYTDTVIGGTWVLSNTNAIIAGGVVLGIKEGTDTIGYIVTNAGGTDTATKIISILPTPAKPVISTVSPSSVCTGTLYQNYGANNPPPNGVSFIWSAVNAIVWATGGNGQNALISFPDPGIATVVLTASTAGTICTSSDSVNVFVNNTVAIIPQVFYFQYHFVCMPANLFSYQWGYDDVATLRSTTLVGENNQDYLNADPDFTGKYYWVNTGENGCIQKTYYNTPVAIQNIGKTEVADITVFPNPAHELVTVRINNWVTAAATIELLNLEGQKLGAVQTANNQATISLENYPSGFYLINCYQNGTKIGTAKFIKK